VPNATVSTIDRIREIIKFLLQQSTSLMPTVAVLLHLTSTVRTLKG